MTNLLEIPKLGFGCMRLPLTDPSDQTSIDLEQFKAMVDAFMEAGARISILPMYIMKALRKLRYAKRWWSVILASRSLLLRNV